MQIPPKLTTTFRLNLLTNVTITIPESYSENTDEVYAGETKALVRRDLTNQGYEIDPKNVNVNYSNKEDSKPDGTSENATFKIQIKYKAEKQIEVPHKVMTKSYGDEVK